MMHSSERCKTCAAWGEIGCSLNPPLGTSGGQERMSTETYVLAPGDAWCNKYKPNYRVYCGECICFAADVHRCQATPISIGKRPDEWCMAGRLRPEHYDEGKEAE